MHKDSPALQDDCAGLPRSSRHKTPQDGPDVRSYPAFAGCNFGPAIGPSRLPIPAWPFAYPASALGLGPEYHLIRADRIVQAWAPCDALQIAGGFVQRRCGRPLPAWTVSLPDVPPIPRGNMRGGPLP